jgi:aspartyl-tRNA(Asn)/glutamyl-tRNA(Gln) amidotransferase subunit C
LPAARPAAIAPDMSVNADQVRHVAKLARIAMSDAEVEAMVPEFNNILQWVEQLAEVDTDGVEPLTAVIDLPLRLRDDVVNDGNVRDDVLKNAPDAQHGFFAVPKVIE